MSFSCQSSVSISVIQDFTGNLEEGKFDEESQKCKGSGVRCPVIILCNDDSHRRVVKLLNMARISKEEFSRVIEKARLYHSLKMLVLCM